MCPVISKAGLHVLILPGPKPGDLLTLTRPDAGFPKGPTIWKAPSPSAKII